MNINGNEEQTPSSQGEDSFLNAAEEVALNALRIGWTRVQSKKSKNMEESDPGKGELM